jgi:hypothetical protein
MFLGVRNQSPASHLLADPLLAKARVGMTASDSTAKMIPTGDVSGSSRLMSDFTASHVM